MLKAIYGSPTCGKSFVIRQLDNVPENVTILDTDELRHFLTTPIFTGSFDVRNNWNNRRRFPLPAKQAYIKMLGDYAGMLDELPGIYVLFTNEPLDIPFEFVFTRNPEDTLYWLRQRVCDPQLPWPEWLPRDKFDVSRLNTKRKIELGRFEFMYDYLADLTKLFC